jgi:hypothetical protein
LLGLNGTSGSRFLNVRPSIDPLHDTLQHDAGYNGRDDCRLEAGTEFRFQVIAQPKGSGARKHQSAVL